jgi:hypothetical protein
MHVYSHILAVQASSVKSSSLPELDCGVHLQVPRCQVLVLDSRHPSHLISTGLIPRLKYLNQALESEFHASHTCSVSSQVHADNALRKMSGSQRIMTINSHLQSGHQAGGGQMEEQDELFTTSDQWHSKPGQLRVISVGAGAAGLLLAYKMQKNFTEYDLVCYEK